MFKTVACPGEGHQHLEDGASDSVDVQRVETEVVHHGPQQDGGPVNLMRIRFRQSKPERVCCSKKWRVSVNAGKWVGSAAPGIQKDGLVLGAAHRLWRGRP